MDTPQIDYAPPLPIHHRKRLRRTIFFVALLIILTPLCWKFGPFAWKQTQILYWQRQAMNYSPPSNQIVYEDDPTQAAKLWSNESNHQPNAGTAFERSAVPWEHLISSGGNAPVPSPVLFLHARRSRDNEEFLVVIEGERSTIHIFGKPRRMQSLYPSRFRCLVIQPATPIASQFLKSEQTIDLDYGASYVSHCQWNAGQADQKDSSHFTLHGIINGKDVNFDGWLTDDAHIKLERRY
jgi:hypothetical protein